MQRKTILFALAALGMLIGGVAVANAATGFLDNSTTGTGPACVDDDTETDDDANEGAEADSDAEVDDGPEDADEGDDCDGETDDGPEDAEETDDKK